MGLISRATWRGSRKLSICWLSPASLSRNAVKRSISPLFPRDGILGVNVKWSKKKSFFEVLWADLKANVLNWWSVPGKSGIVWGTIDRWSMVQKQAIGACNVHFLLIAVATWTRCELPQVASQLDPYWRSFPNAIDRVHAIVLRECLR